MPNGGLPVAANATVLPQECTSADEPLGWPSTISGARYPGVPMNMPVWVILVASGACAMPKSISTGDAARHDHVPRLEVAVHHARGVHGRQALRQPPGEPLQRRAAQRPVVPDHLVERGTGHVAGDHVGHVAGHVGVDDLGHEGAAHPAHRLELPAQPAAGIGVAGHPRAQHLDRDGAPVRITGKVNDAHAALADPLEQAVGAKPVRHRVLRGHRTATLREGGRVNAVRRRPPGKII